jgi:hypothetical protein
MNPVGGAKGAYNGLFLVLGRRVESGRPRQVSGYKRCLAGLHNRMEQ